MERTINKSSNLMKRSCHKSGGGRVSTPSLVLRLQKSPNYSTNKSARAFKKCLRVLLKDLSSKYLGIVRKIKLLQSVWNMAKVLVKNYKSESQLPTNNKLFQEKHFQILLKIFIWWKIVTTKSIRFYSKWFMHQN